MMAQPELSLAAVQARGLIAAVTLFSLFSNLLMLTGPIFMLQVYDRVLASRSEETLVALLGLVAMLYLLYWLLEFARGRVMGRIATRFHSGIAPRVFRAKLDRLASGKGEVATLHDLEAVRAALASGVVLALFDLPWTALFLAAIFLFHPYLGWLAVAGGVLLVLVTLLNQAMTARGNRDAQTLAIGAMGFARQAEGAADYAVAQGNRRDAYGALEQSAGRGPCKLDSRLETRAGCSDPSPAPFASSSSRPCSHLAPGWSCAERSRVER
jgi:ABC-type protease/lipase transport system fused ATPase/permease subunit